MNVVTFLLLVAMATATRCCLGLEEMEKVNIKQLHNLVVEARNRYRHSHGKKVFEVALSDCRNLYEQSESRLAHLSHINSNELNIDDARTLTWLSGVLANHRTCMEGLTSANLSSSPSNEINDINLISYTNNLHNNLTLLLTQSLSFYAQSTRVPRKAPRKPIYGETGGMLASWNPETSRADFVVAKDGSGTHRTINAALSALARSEPRNRRVVIHVKSGVYNEKVEIQRHFKNLMFVGDGIDRTIVTANHNVPDGSSTYNSATFGVSGDGFWARDMTFENTAGPQKHQAVALRVNSDLAVFYRCSFRAYQDTLFEHSLRQFYRDCHIYGTIDFIFGDAPVVFQNCDILVRRPMNHQANMITAQGRDNPHETTGISIQGCRVRAAPDFVTAKNSFRTYLGRPWKKYSRTVFMETELDGLIHPQGWTEWDGSFAPSTLYYAEYKNRGAGASTQRRVKWPGFHVLHSPQEASSFSVSKFIQGEDWIPATGVPFQLGI